MKNKILENVIIRLTNDLDLSHINITEYKGLRLDKETAFRYYISFKDNSNANILAVSPNMTEEDVYSYTKDLIETHYQLTELEVKYNQFKERLLNI